MSATLPTTVHGLESTGVAILQNAIADGARVDVVNVMTFDYYDKVTTDMGGAAISATQIWSMEGNTILSGIDDYPKKRK